MTDDSESQSAGDCGPSCTCGAPQRQTFSLSVPPRASTPAASGSHPIPQAQIPAGTFLMGDSSGDENRGDGETPVHAVRMSAFEIDTTTVTNDAFAAFVDATGYRTEAETFGFSAVFHLALTAPESDIMGQAAQTPWWLGVKGADWRHPGGAGSSIDDLGDHPVVHVSHNDALAYCAWAGRMLPTEAQWEYASRGGLDSRKYPWGDEEVSDGGWRVNIWQGSFPRVNTLEDGFLTTAPVRTFQPNGYGLWQTVGNVWEWCADWYDPRYYARSAVADPPGPASGSARVMRGGSFLCHISYCNRYRNSARSQNTPDSSMSNAGFRTVAAV
ncbi:formylglycine-generating enzyme family protein [Microbacterium suwonense]|uniref:Sulfatase-modifying factor enzyme-like domain-containing protein n=1 Tax=Microbacterium suwonense TaxID=683047 RepID=A0ABM8FWQ6_9MICO|nr:formylglycine-generating enzyme family protein [Microbacterium suwonense]BDZ40121.1 hypothetical protein GCM10025863_27350 [Microbacterium suwonense]